MKAKDIIVEYYDPTNDLLQKSTIGDTRRPKLTLSHLRKLRKISEYNKYEKAQRMELVKLMYGQPPMEEF